MQSKCNETDLCVTIPKRWSPLEYMLQNHLEHKMVSVDLNQLSLTKQSANTHTQKGKIFTFRFLCSLRGSCADAHLDCLYFPLTPLERGNYPPGFEACTHTQKGKDFHLSLFVLPQGLEPWTPTLRVSCSTN